MGRDSTIIYLSIIIYSSSLSNIETDVFGLPESAPCSSIFFNEMNDLLANIDNDSLSYYSDVYTLKTCAKIYPVIFTLPNATNCVYTTV